MDTNTTGVARALEREFGRPRRRRSSLLECLVKTILSQNTNDDLRDAAYEAILRELGSLERLRDAPPEEIERLIRPAGLPKQKSRAIKEIFKIDLKRVCKMEPEEAYRLLTSLKGIGDKTAKVCLLFVCRMPFFPVDTHIARVASRMGLASGSRERISRRLEELFDPKDYYPLHINLMRLGRAYCKPRNPLCSSCPVRDYCASANE